MMIRGGEGRYEWRIQLFNYCVSRRYSWRIDERESERIFQKTEVGGSF